MNHAVYLHFNGNAEDALNFYQKTLGAQLRTLQRYNESPVESSASYQDKILHAILDLNGMTVMVSDASEEKKVQMGDNISLVINCSSDGELNRLFDSLSTGGQVILAVEQTFWGSSFGMCVDKFGIHWMVNYEKPK